MKNTYWARAPLAREQIVLFPTKLDEVIPDGHPARPRRIGGDKPFSVRSEDVNLAVIDR